MTASPSVCSATTRKATAWRTQRAGPCTPTPASRRRRTGPRRAAASRPTGPRRPSWPTTKNIHLDICECGYGGCSTNCPAAAAAPNNGACQLSPKQRGLMKSLQSTTLASTPRGGPTASSQQSAACHNTDDPLQSRYTYIPSRVFLGRDTRKAKWSQWSVIIIYVCLFVTHTWSETSFSCFFF